MPVILATLRRQGSQVRSEASLRADRRRRRGSAAAGQSCRARHFPQFFQSVTSDPLYRLCLLALLCEICGSSDARKRGHDNCPSFCEISQKIEMSIRTGVSRIAGRLGLEKNSEVRPFRVTHAHPVYRAIHFRVIFERGFIGRVAKSIPHAVNKE